MTHLPISQGIYTSRNSYMLLTIKLAICASTEEIKNVFSTPLLSQHVIPVVLTRNLGGIFYDNNTLILLNIFFRFAECVIMICSKFRTYSAVFAVLCYKNWSLVD